MRIVLDTGVIIAFAAEETDKSIDSIERIFNFSKNSKLNAYISSITISEIYAFFYKKKDPKKAVEIVLLLDEIGVNVVNLDGKIAKDSGVIKSKYSISFADAIILATCAEINASLITYDKEFSDVKEVQVLKPEDLLKLL